MTEKQQAKLFQHYNQAEDSTSRKFGGTGLGLTICKTLVELMGGKINVISAQGEGSTFYYELPSQLDNSSENTDYRINENPAHWHNPGLKGKKLLIMHNNEHFCLTYKKLCESWGMQVTYLCQQKN